MQRPFLLLLLFTTAATTAFGAGACNPQPSPSLGGTGGATPMTGAGTGGAGPSTGGVTATGGAPATGGTGGGGATDGGVGPGMDAGSLSDDCPEAPVPRRSSGTIVQLPFELSFAGKPFVFGEPNVVATTGTVTPLNVRFYISGVALLRANAAAVPVDLVTAAGTVEPYGIHLFNADEVASGTLRVLAPPGSYVGISFLLGLDGACNARMAGSSKAPLTDTSQMTWPHLAGYLFLRYEANVVVPAGSDGKDLPAAIHMGGRPRMPFAPVIEIKGSLEVPATGSPSKIVRLVMDEVFKGATTQVDLTGFVGLPDEEVIAGERLRRNAPNLRLFVFGP